VWAETAGGGDVTGGNRRGTGRRVGW